MNSFDNKYLELIQDILRNGNKRVDRTGTGTISVFGRMLQLDLNEGFPAMTTKKLAFKTMCGELACFLKGLTHIDEYHKRGVKIWDANLVKTFGAGATDLGPIYGVQWRDFGGVDQLRDVVNRAKIDPTDRRLLVSAWNPPKFPEMALPPCHYAWQIYINDNKVSILFNMRSCDVMLGLPFNVSSYALIAHLIANELGMGVGTLTAVLGDTHIYLNHMQGVEEQLTRKATALPTLKLHMSVGDAVESFEPEMAELVGYNPAAVIKMEMSA